MMYETKSIRIWRTGKANYDLIDNLKKTTDGLLLRDEKEVELLKNSVEWKVDDHNRFDDAKIKKRVVMTESNISMPWGTEKCYSILVLFCDGDPEPLFMCKVRPTAVKIEEGGTV